MKKVIIFCVAILLFVAVYFGYTQYKTLKIISEDTQVSIDDIDGIDKIENIDENLNGFVIISDKDALQLVSEQIDLTKYKVELSQNILKDEQFQYYLFDVVNKEGPSFPEQIAVNTTTGELFSFVPSIRELKSMSDFPIETPISKQQEWSGDFVSEDGKYVLHLYQADLNSFEFFVEENKLKTSDSSNTTVSLMSNDDDDDDDDDRVTNPSIDKNNQNSNNQNTVQLQNSLLEGIAKIDGSQAKFKDDTKEIIFTKNDKVVVLNIISKDESMSKLSGKYKMN